MSRLAAINKTIITVPVKFIGPRNRLSFNLAESLVTLIAPSDKYTCPVDEISTNH